LHLLVGAHDAAKPEHKTLPATVEVQERQDYLRRYAVVRETNLFVLASGDTSIHLQSRVSLE
jgi:hypothetical protein